MNLNDYTVILDIKFYKVKGIENLKIKNRLSILPPQ